MRKKLLLLAVATVCCLCASAQRYGSWHSSVTGRDYGVLVENVKGKSFDCLIYGQSLNKHIPIVGMRLSSKHIPAFVKELRSLADKNMKDAHVEAYTQMMFLGDDAVYLSVAPIVDKDKNRHPGFFLPFGSKQEIDAFIKAVESLNPNVEEAYCLYCDANLTTCEAHKKNCPYALDTEENDSSPSSQSTQSVQHPHEIHITCPQCGAVFSGKSASLAFKNGRNHNQVPEVPQVPQAPKIQ